jgi:hypothetical protein
MLCARGEHFEVEGFGAADRQRQDDRRRRRACEHGPILSRSSPACALFEQWERPLKRFCAREIGIVGDGACRLEAVTVMAPPPAARHQVAPQPVIVTTASHP